MSQAARAANLRVQQSGLHCVPASTNACPSTWQWFPPCVLDAILKKLDAAVEAVFCVLVHTERLSPAERCQIQLHVSRGGFGLPSFRRRAAVVYASTTLRLLPLLARRATTDPEWVAWERSAATMQCMQYIHEQWGLALDAQMNLVPMAAVPEWNAILHAVH